MAGSAPVSQLHAAGFVRGADLALTVDGKAIIGHEGETVAGLLWRQGRGATRRTPQDNAPRAYFCGMAACFECLVVVDGQQRQGCITVIAPGMDIRTIGTSGV